MPRTDARRLLAPLVIALLLAAAPAARAATGDLDLVSRADGASGAGGNGASTLPDVSTDGSLVAFASAATNLTADGATGTQAYVRSVVLGTTLLASRADGANGAAANANVSDVGISDNGRYVVFDTRATNLGVTAPGVDRVYVRDLTAHTTTLVAEGVRPAISADGSTIAYGAQSSGSQKIFAYDVQSHAVSLVSSSPTGTAMTGDNPALSADGQTIAFTSGAQVWVRDRRASTTVLASRASGVAGEQASSAATEPTISGDGRYVAFSSGATNLSDDDVDSRQDVYERDLVDATTTLVSRADGATGPAGNGNSDTPSISDDGARVLFRSTSTNLAAGTPSGDSGYVRDTQAGTTTWVTQAASGNTSQGDMGGDGLSGDGRWAVFATSATLLPAQETGAHSDVFRRDLGAPPAPPPPPAASIGADQSITEGNSGTSTPATFAVTLSHKDPRPITVDWATGGGTATAGADYRAATGQVTFAPGQTIAYLSVDVLGDDTDEPDETFGVRLSAPVDATLDRLAATVTIRDDDLPPPPAAGGVIVAPPPTPFLAHTGTPATTCATQITQGAAVLRGCFDHGKGTGVVSLDGLRIDLGSGALAVSATKIESTGQVTVTAGDVVVHRGKLTVDPKAGTATLTPPAGTDVYGLTLQPRLALNLAAGGVANLAGYATLPIGGTPLPLTFSTSDADGLRRDTLAATSDALVAGRLTATGVAFRMDPAARAWRGGFTALTLLPTGAPQKLSGTIDRQGAMALTGPFTHPTAGVDMSPQTLTFVQSPLGFSVPVHFNTGPFKLLEFDGTMTDTLGQAPVTTGELKLFGFVLGSPPDFLHSALSILAPPNVVPSGGGGLLGKDSGILTGRKALVFGAAPDNLTPPAPPPAALAAPLAAVGGAIPAFDFALDPVHGQFSGSGSGEFNLLGVNVAGQTVANNNGFAACGDIGFLHAGLGVHFNPFGLTLMGPFTCDVGPWRATAAAAQAGPRTVRLPGGVQILRLHGTGEATLHGPGGRTVSTAGAPLVSSSAVVLKDPAGFIYVALNDAPGRWTIDGPGITAVDSAAQLPPARVTARVTGHAIHWSARLSAGQAVTLAEQGTGVYHVLGALHGRRGTLRFTPAAGGGARSIVALVTEGGLPASRRVVAHYTAPRPARPGRPGRIRVAFSGRMLSVRWGAARGARSYVVTATTPNGTLVAVTGKRRATLTDILPVTRATVSVRAAGGGVRSVSARRRR